MKITKGGDRSALGGNEKAVLARGSSDIFSQRRALSQS